MAVFLGKIFEKSKIPFENVKLICSDVFCILKIFSRENLAMSQLFPWHTISHEQTRRHLERQQQQPKHHIVLRSTNHFKNCYFSPIQCVLVEEQ
ncbi:unnamed protein product [Brugia pahangi]|uniref:Uncharacterized protein n=1 Tax=Brugia pahangi TaxID=6280 RepID=A0A0N4TN65_BRUPA|nr:unnamed protein product [Brugia pahangi]